MTSALAAHLTDPSVRVIELGEAAVAYERGHIPNVMTLYRRGAVAADSTFRPTQG